MTKIARKYNIQVLWRFVNMTSTLCISNFIGFYITPIASNCGYVSTQWGVDHVQGIYKYYYTAMNY